MLLPGPMFIGLYNSTSTRTIGFLCVLLLGASVSYGRVKLLHTSTRSLSLELTTNRTRSNVPLNILANAARTIGFFTTTSSLGRHTC